MKFSIITPAYKAERWVRDTIESVLSQEGDFDIEYIFVVDQSEDRTEDIAREYEAALRSGTYPIRARSVTMQVIRPHERAGMYVALNTGFAAATGDIHAWMPADDTYEPGAFRVAAAVFTSYPDIAWIRGTTTSINAQNEIVQLSDCQIYYRPWIRAGIYGMEAYHIDQTSVFWRASLWHQAGVFPAWCTLMGDYGLWISFSKYARLWTVDAPIGRYRKHPDQGSAVYAAGCREQMWKLRGNRRPPIAWIARLFFYPYYNLVPMSARPYMRKLYPILFPHHSREYIAFDKGGVVKKTLSTFAESR